MISRFTHKRAAPKRPGTGMADAPLPERRRKRFSLSGSIGFERRIATDQQRIADQVLKVLPPDEFRALYLCGSYGRGEGVRLRAADGKEIADAYQYGVVLGRTDAALRDAVQESLRRLAEALSATTGVAIGFWLFREEQLSDRPLSMPQADLRWSGRLLRGDPETLARMTGQPFEYLAPGEMLWRHVELGLGLLHNQECLRRDSRLPEHARTEFFRHLIRTVISCGDLRLAVVGRYHPAHAEKLARLEALDQRHHRKFMALYTLAHQAYAEMDIGGFSEGHPLDWQARVSWLWLDALRRFEQWRRGGRVLPSWEFYCHPRPEKGQGWRTSISACLNANLACFGAASLKSQPRWSLRHPRERLIGAMPLLLGGPQTAPEPAVAMALSLPPGTSWPRTVETFLALCAAQAD